MPFDASFTCDLEPDCPPYLKGFRGVEEGLPKLLMLLEQLGVRATFFTTGEVAQKYPEAVRAVLAGRHELACHGMTHTAFTTMPRDQARAEITESAAILRDHAAVTSFRAPYLRFPDEYLDLLEEAGFDLDSSQAKYKKAYYDSRRHRTRATLKRIPASLTSSALRIPRLLREAYVRAVSKPVVLFVHPWEFVDLRHEKLRFDCRFRTGDVAIECVRDVLRGMQQRGARFMTMQELGEQRRHNHKQIPRFAQDDKRISRMKRSAQLLAWVGATGLLIYFVSRVDRVALRGAAAVVDWKWIVVAILANALILASWAGLWWTASPRDERPGYRVMFEINAMASALMNTMPFLGGHAAAVVLMVKRASMSRAAALSVLALDQLGEGLAKVAIFLVVAAAAPLPDWMRVGVATLSAGVGALLVGMVILAHSHAHIRPDAEKPLTIMNRMRVMAATWAQRMETLRSVRQSLAALAFALGTKVAEGAGLLAVQHAFGVELSVGSTALVLGAVVLGSILPVTPGNVGTYEAGAFLAYRHLGIDPATATILAIACHTCFMIPSVGIGYVLGSWKLRSVVTA